MTIVGITINSSGQQKPVYWERFDQTTPPTPLTLPNGVSQGSANGINNLGEIVGNTIDGRVPTTPLYWEKFDQTTPPAPLSLPNGVSKGNAYGINNLGQIVGYTINNNLLTPVYWERFDQTTPPTPLSLPNGVSWGIAFGINTLGQIVGFTRNSSGQQKPVYWERFDQTTPPTPLTLPNGVSEGNAYGINNLGQIVGITLNSGQRTPVYWERFDQTTPPTPLTLPNGVTQGNAVGINTLGEIVGSTIDGPVPTPLYWEKFDQTTPPTPLTLPNGATGGFALRIADPPTPTPTPISNICFPAGTPIKTDQGSVNIELLDKRIHTINKHTILHITRTTTLDKYLIKFEKNALNRNCPSQKTIMTKDHLLEFQGRMVPAYRFLDYSDQVKKVKYNGEVLYNVLLAQHGKMEVNNLVCETLHPENIIAKLYTAHYMDHERTAIVNQLNNSLQTRDLSAYKDVLSRLSKTTF